MNDRELEARLRAFYRTEVGANETAPPSLRQDVAAIPHATPIPIRPLGGRRGFTLLAAAALLLVGGALAAGSGLLRLPSVVPPQPAPSLAAETSGPTISPSPVPTATPVPVPPRAPSWAATGSMITPRAGFAAVLLPDGKVLAMGGMNGTKALASAELYDPATGTWTATGSMVSHAGRGAGWAHMTATLLRDGRVLVAGGVSGTVLNLASAELYDPGTGTWTATGSMLTPRADHTATLLSDGRVLVAGGQPMRPVASAELYDPATGTWTATGSMGTVRAEHAATLLSDGRVLVAGGEFSPEPWSSSNLSSAELYDPGTGTWAYARSMSSAGGGSPALLPDGRVLLDGTPPQLYDPGTRSWTATGGKVIAGFDGPDVLLANGGVLALGAAKPGEYNPTRTVAYLFDPGAGSWTAAGKLAVHRYGYTATLLPDGRVLVAGGSDADAANQNALATAELFDPGTWSPSPILPATPAPSPTPYAAQPDGSMFAYLQGGRLWVANRDGTGAHELLPDLVGNPGSPAWSSDGTRLVFSMIRDGDPNGVSRLYLTDARGSEPQLVDTGCIAPCTGDSDAAFSSDGTRLVFVRTVRPTLTVARSVLATVDLTTGHVAELASTTVSAADYHPRWSPDGTRIVFTQDVPNHASGKASTFGPFPAVFVVDADGGNFHQIGPAALTADWSPDGARIVFESVSEVDIRYVNLDIYTIRPDGSALRRLTSDQGSIEASWTADGRIVFIRAPKKLANGYVKPLGPPQFWIMDADGGNATQLSVSPKLIDLLIYHAAAPFSWPPKP
jgi:Tol biopolymer transport system component